MVFAAGHSFHFFSTILSPLVVGVHLDAVAQFYENSRFGNLEPMQSTNFRVGKLLIKYVSYKVTAKRQIATVQVLQK